MKKQIFAFISSTVLAISATILIYYILNLNNIENFLRYFGVLLIFSVVLLIVCLTLIYAKKKKKFKMVGFILLIIISLIFTAGFSFLNYNLMIVNKTLNKITSSLETVSVSLVSLEKNDDILNIKNEKIAVIDENVSSNINKLSLELIDTLKYGNETVVYEDFYHLADDLQDKKVSYAILPSNYIEIYSVYEEYEELAQELVVNLSKETTQETEQEEIVTKNINEPFTILIMGVDTLSSSYNADTLMVITFNPQTLTATMLSIPRDTYTTLSNGAKHKINASGWSGDRSVVRTVSNYLGINIDYYFKINFTGAVSLVDAVGGIDVVVPYSFCEQNSKRQWGANTIFVEKGLQHLNGEQALALTRNRHSPSDSKMMKAFCPTYNEGVRNDFIRGKNQQLVIRAMLDSLKNIKDLDTFYSIFDALGKNISTNMSRDTILSFYNLGKTILEKTDGIELTDAIKIQKLFFTSYVQTIRIGNLNLSTVGHYGGSLDAIKNAMKENLGLKDKETIKSISFDINTPYTEKVIGQGIYTNKNAPVVMQNYVKKDFSVIEKWATDNGYTIEKEEKEITDNSYVNNAVISHTPLVYTDLSTLKDKVIKVVVAKVTTSTPIAFNYQQCLDESFKDDERCILTDYTNSSITTFKNWINKTGISFDITYEEVDGDDDKIISQSVKNRSIYDIKNNNLSINIKYNVKKEETDS